MTLKRALRRLLIAAGVTLLAIAITIPILLHRTLPPTTGAFTLPSLSAPVTITFDTQGIPFIRAATETDAAEALGYLHASSRLFQMDLMRRAASGTLAALFGPIALQNDEEMRRLGILQSAESDQSSLSPQARAMLQAYADGVNAYIAQRGRFAAPEFLLLGRPAPWTITDSILWGKVLGLWLSGNWRIELERLALSPRQPQAKILSLWPPDTDVMPETAALATPSLAAAARAVLAWIRYFPEPFTQPTQASNEWAVAGSRTASGHPLLAGDPHLGFGFPSLWYLARIDLPGETLAGATAPGIPFLVIGHNRNIAWTFTDTGAAVQDIFIEHPTKDGKAYETPTGPQPFQTRTETIQVRGHPDVVLKILITRHGPIIGRTPDGKNLLAVEMANLAPHDTDADGLLALNQATSVANAATAAGLITSPVQNLLVADTAHIGFYTTGLIPVRKAGDGAWPVDGADGAHDWLRLAGSPELPRAIDPPSGELINANNPTVGPNFPVFITRDTYGDWRARRIKTLLDTGTPETLETFARIQHDTTSAYAQTVLPGLLALNLPPADPAAPALALLRNWHGSMAMNLAQPLIFNAWTTEFINEILTANAFDPDKSPYLDDFLISLVGAEASPSAVAMWCKGDCTPILKSSLETAITNLKTAYGENPAAWRWGDAHRAMFAHPLLGYLPVIGRFFRFSIPVGGDGATIAAAAYYPTGTAQTVFTAMHGPEFRAVFDLADLDASLFIVAPGESGSLLSRHAGDLLRAWRDGDYITLPAEPANVANTMTLEPIRAAK
jgi:penicillin amidase